MQNLSIVEAINFSSGVINSSIPILLTASPHRTGYPTSLSFSNIKTDTPFSAANLAAIEPAGPAPTTIISYFLFKWFMFIFE